MRHPFDCYAYDKRVLKNCALVSYMQRVKIKSYKKSKCPYISRLIVRENTVTMRLFSLYLHCVYHECVTLAGPKTRIMNIICQNNCAT